MPHKNKKRKLPEYLYLIYDLSNAEPVVHPFAKTDTICTSLRRAKSLIHQRREYGEDVAYLRYKKENI